MHAVEHCAAILVEDGSGTAWVERALPAVLVKQATFRHIRASDSVVL